MNKSRIKANLVYGVVTVIPIAIVIVLFDKVLEILDLITKTVGLDSYLSAGAAVVLALVLLIAAIYVIGTLVRTRIGSWTYEKIEQKLLIQVPGYKIVSSILKGFVEKNDEYRPVLVKPFESDTAVIGFVMDTNADGTVTVFSPSSPLVTVGNIYVVNAERVTPIDASHIEAISCISDWGVGTAKLLNSQKGAK